MATNRISDLIAQESGRYGVPSWIPDAISRRESNQDPATIGDNGTSFGLFQLHRGGLAPANLSDTQLLDPLTNTDIALASIKPAYDQGASLGLSGFDLLAYTANNSGFPSSRGVAFTNRVEPSYDQGLAVIYAQYEREAAKAASGQPAQALDQHYADHTSTSTVAQLFRAISQKEQIESYKDWKKQAGVLEKYNPLAYVGDQGQALSVRILLAIIALVVIALSLAAIILPIAEKGAADAETGQPVPIIE